MAKVLFLHVPKAAGTSIMSVLYNTLGPEKVYWFGHENDPLEFLRANDYSAFQKYDVIGGHLEFLDAQKVIEGRIVCSIMREPVSRAISLFNFITKTNTNHPLHSEIKNYDLLTAMERSPRFRQEIENKQCRILAGANSSKEVLRKMIRYPFVVDTTENAQRVFDVICDNVGLTRGTLPSVNAAPSGYDKNIVTAAATEMINAITKEDKAVFEFLKELGDTSVGD